MIDGTFDLKCIMCCTKGWSWIMMSRTASDMFCVSNVVFDCLLVFPGSEYLLFVLCLLGQWWLYWHQETLNIFVLVFCWFWLLFCFWGSSYVTIVKFVGANIYPNCNIANTYVRRRSVPWYTSCEIVICFKFGILSMQDKNIFLLWLWSNGGPCKWTVSLLPYTV